MTFDPGRIVVAELLRLLGIDAEHRGDRWWACCPSPSHDDKDPSWAITDAPGTEANGLFFCFACKYGGTAPELAADTLGLSSIASGVEWVLAKACGRPVVPSRVEVQVMPLRTGFRMPRGVTFGPMATWPGPPADYARSRGVTAEQVDRWGLGYALEGPLNGRIVIPTRDAHGLMVGYAARSYTGAPKRYLSASREDNPDPGAVLGEHLWPKAPAMRHVLAVTEGALNALAVERAARSLSSVRADLLDLAGDHLVDVTALSGSNVQLRQILKVSSFRRVLLLTDPDPAGDRAAQLIADALARHAEVKRVRLPKGEDAQSVGDVELAGWIARAL